MSFNKPPLITVVIPVYNDSDRLYNCIKAITRQSKGFPVEIIVMDDGSTDGSRDVARKFKVKLKSNNKREGQSKMRNRGAQIARGKFILFIDSDVEIESNTIKRAINFVKKYKKDRLCGLQGTFSLNNTLVNWPSLIYNSLQNLLFSTPVYSSGVNTSCLLIEREVFLSLDGFNEKIWFMEDTEFGRRLGNAGYYLKRSDISFKHKKNISWGWLFKVHILGGMMQIFLKRNAPLFKSSNKKS